MAHSTGNSEAEEGEPATCAARALPPARM